MTVRGRYDRALSSVARNNGGQLHRARLLAVSLGVWLAALIGPYILMSTWSARITPSGIVPILQLLGLLQFVVLAIILPKDGLALRFRNFFNSFGGITFIMFAIVALFSAFGAHNPVWVVASAFAVLGVFFASWTAAPLMGRITAAGWLWLAGGLVVYMAILLIVLGYRNQTVGFIQPNQYAKIALVAMVLAMFSGSRTRWFFVVAAIFVAGLVSSRNAFLFITLFCISYAFLVKRNRIIEIGAVIFIFIIAFTSFEIVVSGESFLLSRLDQRIFLVTSETFGLGSGFTGRIEYWREGFSLVTERPLFGYGFNSRESTDAQLRELISAHQGYLNLILDVGLLGFLAFSTLVGGALHLGHRRIRRKQPGRDRIAVAMSTIIGYLGAMFFDPFYLSIGFPLSVIFILCLALCLGPSFATVHKDVAPPSRALSRLVR